MKRARGFTLIELMIVVALVAILGTVAAPGFRDLLVNQRLVASQSEFVAALGLARTEAMKRSQTVSLTPLNQDWSNGWQVAATVDGKAEVVRTFDALRTGVAVDTTTGSGFNKVVSFDANGFAKGKAGGFGGGCLTFKADTGRRSSIVVSVTGRPKVCDPDKKGDCGSGACGS
ncbi:GspH/FimT family pseudopilin [Variovorax sp. GT1P44]|uniref:GspH/FimT family pseudopilin n=1 Tax=Variovorax sp. GT1P44 TaxID=3443742 RepID=UPI003F453717